MATDFYRQRLAHAAWTWREACLCHGGGCRSRKDRIEGRREKRRARALERREIRDQLL